MHFLFKETYCSHKLLSLNHPPILCCWVAFRSVLLPLWAAYAPRFCGEDYVVTKWDPVGEVFIVFRQRTLPRFVWRGYGWGLVSSWVRRNNRFDQRTLCRTRRICCVCLDIRSLRPVWWVVAIWRFSVVVRCCVFIARCWCGCRCVNEQRIGYCRVAVPR